MKTAFVAWLIFGLVGVVVFGFAGMSASGEHEHGGCIAAQASGLDCPKESGALNFVIFHLDVLKSFGRASVAPSPLAGLVLVLLMLISGAGFGAMLIRSQPQAVNISAAYWHELTRSQPFPSQRQVSRWLALREHSPTIF